MDEVSSKNYISCNSQPKANTDKKSESDFSSFTFDIKSNKKNSNKNKMMNIRKVKTKIFSKQWSLLIKI